MLIQYVQAICTTTNYALIPVVVHPSWKNCQALGVHNPIFLYRSYPIREAMASRMRICNIFGIFPVAREQRITKFDSGSEVTFRVVSSIDYDFWWHQLLKFVQKLVYLVQVVRWGINQQLKLKKA